MWKLGDRELKSRLLLGTARYPSPQDLIESIQDSATEVITVSLRREQAGEQKGGQFWNIVREHTKYILPNTAGCHSVAEAITTAHMARELFGTTWIKLEVIGNDLTLQPDPFKTVEAAKILIEEGFTVFPYTTDDLLVAEKLVELGCSIVMPWAAPIGTGKGILFKDNLKRMRSHLKDTTLIIDAGIGAPSHAAAAMEMGFDGVLLNTAVAKAHHPASMARAFAQAIEAGRAAYLAGIIHPCENAVPSTPIVGIPFWHQGEPS